MRTKTKTASPITTEITLKIPGHLARKMAKRGIDPKEFFAGAVAAVANDAPREIDYMFDCYAKPGGGVNGVVVTYDD